MPRPVCVTCTREMTLTRSIVVQFDAIATGGAYEQYHGDVAKCPECGAEIAFRYGSASWRHHKGPDGKEKPDVTVPERLFGLPVVSTDTLKDPPSQPMVMGSFEDIPDNVLASVPGDTHLFHCGICRHVYAAGEDPEEHARVSHPGLYRMAKGLDA